MPPASASSRRRSCATAPSAWAFHAEPKLRTVLWDFAGEPIPVAARDCLCRLQDALIGDLGPVLADLLDDEEIEVLGRRLQAALAAKKFPAPGPGRSFPWPPI